MHGLIIAAAFLLLQDQDDGRIRRLEERIRDRESRHTELERKMDRAIQDDRAEDAERYRRLARETEQELRALRQELDKARGAVEPPPRLAQWYHDLNASFTYYWTHFDDSLDLEDAGGWGVGLAFRNFISIEMRRWDGEDEAADDDAKIVQYLVSFTPRVTLKALQHTEFGIGLSFGLFRIDSDAPGGDEDRGMMLSLTPTWGYLANDWLRLNFGFNVDLMRTHFHSHSTNTEVDTGVLLGFELAF